jgi:hypothetical protein
LNSFKVLFNRIITAIVTDMNDIQYAALTQIATAPLTAAYCYKTYQNNTIHTNGIYKVIQLTFLTSS